MYLASTALSATQPDTLTNASLRALVSSNRGSSVLSKPTEWRSRGSLQSSLSEVCGLLTIAAPEYSSEENILFQHVHYKTGKRIHTIGQNFDTLYIVNSGFLKIVWTDEYGSEQVLGFPMKGDLLGIDAIHSKRHATELVALSDCDLILLPYKTFSNLGRKYAELEQCILSVMSRELVREQSHIRMLNALGAEAKVARFLTELGERYSQLGYSGKVYNLRMTRLEIASYLGLAIETVSRTLSAFHELGLIAVYQRQIDIIDAKSLTNFRKLPQSKPNINITPIANTKITGRKEKILGTSIAKKCLPQWKKESAVIAV
ncbi:Crp/Fnr family transcriptional regulator [Undibacterium sp. Ren11W]|uniref:Crp/Fnr family transcriptional regulator n=1 Tax=Undibacterium sp. Ren11W TaxID=3413045 RepID=UPI003BF02D78